MNIQPTNSLAFKGLHVDQTIRDLQKSINRPARFKQDIAYVSRLVREQNLHKNEKFDVTLKYIEKDGFYVTLDDKGTGSLNSSNMSCKIYPNRELNQDFNKWVVELLK